MQISNNLLGQGYVKERLKLSKRKFYGRYGNLINQYEAPLSRMLHEIRENNIMQWYTPIDKTLHQFMNLFHLYWTGPYYRIWLYSIVWGFYKAFVMDVTCQQRTLTPPDTWSCPTFMLIPTCPKICLLSGLWTFEHPSVLLFYFCSKINFIEKKTCNTLCIHIHGH